MHTPRIPLLIGTFLIIALGIGADLSPRTFAAPSMTQASTQSVADLGLKLPFPPGKEWKITAGWDATPNHQQNWDWRAVDFVPVGVTCKGQPIIAAAPGVVRNTNTGIIGTRSARHEVEIDHGTFNGVNYRTLYVHLDTITVSDGQNVTYGTKIGTCGDWAAPDGAHLHFQLFQGPVWDATDGIIPVPINGITDQNSLKAGQVGLYSTNSGIAPPKMDINTPGDGQTVAGDFVIGGWAIHEAAASGTGVNEVHIYFDGGAGSGARSVAATYGIRRDDVATAFGDRYRYAGYQFALNSSELSIGQHTIHVYAHSTAIDQWQEMTRTFTVANAAPNVPIQATPNSGATVTGPTVQFTWQDPGDADNRPRNYRDYLIEVKDSGGQIVAQMPWTATTSWNTSLADGAYTWHIQSGDGAVGSGWSADWGFTVQTLRQTPTAPSNFTVSGTTEYGVSLSWQDNASNESGYRIYRWNGSGWPLYASLGPDVTSFTDSGLLCNQGYSYRLAVFNDAGEVFVDGWIDGFTTACQTAPLPAAPTGFQTSSTNEHNAMLTWQDNANNESGYRIYRWNGVDWPLYASLEPDVTSFLDSELLCNQGYSYQLAVFNAAGEVFVDGWIDAFTTACQTTNPIDPGSDYRVFLPIIRR
ncbi:peptidoglycan DD-metalloendopeptidase family protein [Chloroflexales bacterium ZM16-3]|nr:peptidoglycan DD-metalloendopeptidase family protein [Chloroflexales bacterium ZM16-3]